MNNPDSPADNTPARIYSFRVNPRALPGFYKNKLNLTSMANLEGSNRKWMIRSHQALVPRHPRT